MEFLCYEYALSRAYRLSRFVKLLHGVITLSPCNLTKEDHKGMDLWVFCSRSHRRIAAKPLLTASINRNKASPLATLTAILAAP
jgi:hypothetical protein